MVGGRGDSHMGSWSEGSQAVTLDGQKRWLAGWAPSRSGGSQACWYDLQANYALRSLDADSKLETVSLTWIKTTSQTIWILGFFFPLSFLLFQCLSPWLGKATYTTILFEYVACRTTAAELPVVNSQVHQRILEKRLHGFVGGNQMKWKAICSFSSKTEI